MAPPPATQVTLRFQAALGQALARMGAEELARRAGLSPRQVDEALEPAAAPDLGTQAALAAAAGYEYEDFLSLGRRLTAPSPDTAAPAWPWRDGGAAGLLLHVAASFRLAEGEDDLCGRITEALLERMGFRRAWLMLLKGQHLETRALRWPAGDEAGLRAALAAHPPNLGADPMVYESFALTRALPVVVGRESFFDPAVRQALGLGSEVALAPLFSEREFIGALAADHGPAGPGCGGEETLSMLEAIATLAGTLLNSLRLYAEVERKNQELDIHLRQLTVVGELTSVINQVKEPAQAARRMLRFLAQALEADFGFLFLYRYKAGELRLVGSHGLKPGLQEQWALLRDVPADLLDMAPSDPDPPERSASLRRLLPGLEGPAQVRVLTARQRAVGLWGLGRWDLRHPFQSGERRVLATADEQMSVALNSMRLRLVASTDYLTALSTRAHFVEALEQELRLARYLGHPLGLLLLDADHFKNVNDNHGHQAGDQVLSDLGRVLRACTRGDDTCARVGGEEFAVILPRCDLEGALAAAEKIRAQVAAQATNYRGQDLRITVSLGLAILEPGQNLPQEEFLRRADQALYRAKRGGRDRVECYQPGQDAEAWGSLA